MHVYDCFQCETCVTQVKHNTHKGFVHGSFDLVWTVRVDLLEELVECRVSLHLLIFLLLVYLHHQLVPLAGVVGRCGVLVWWRKKSLNSIRAQNKKSSLLLWKHFKCSLTFLIKYADFYHPITAHRLNCQLVTNFTLLATESSDLDGEESHCDWISIFFWMQYTHHNPNKRWRDGGESRKCNPDADLHKYSSKMHSRQIQAKCGQTEMPCHKNKMSNMMFKWNRSPI